MDEANKPALTRSGPQSGWRTIAVRVMLAASLVMLAFALLWFDRDGLKDNIDGHVSFTDTIYFTMITITTVGYGDIIPVSDRARMIDAFLITPIRLFVWLIFLGTAFNFLLKRSWEKWRMKMIQKNLHDHIIIAGFGSSGRKSLQELLSAGVPATRIVVIDCLEERVQAARELGAATIQGDASRDELLSSAMSTGIDHLGVGRPRRHVDPDCPPARNLAPRSASESPSGSRIMKAWRGRRAPTWWSTRSASPASCWPARLTVARRRLYRRSRYQLGQSSASRTLDRPDGIWNRLV